VADPTFVHRRVRTCSVFFAGDLGVTNCITLVSRGAAAAVAAAEEAEETTTIDVTSPSAAVESAAVGQMVGESVTSRCVELVTFVADTVSVDDASLLRWLAAIQLPFKAA
jgi:hypothetical protein